MIAPKATRFDLESSRDLARLQEPLLALEGLQGLVIIDEVQHRPDLFPILRVLADRRPVRTRFLVLGSASPPLLRQGSESLAGRIAWHELPGLGLGEIGAARLDRLWLRGGFPLSFTASTDERSMRWRQEFIRTYAHRDLAALGIGISPQAVERFWRMLAHSHGQIWNAAELARAFGVAEKTVRGYLDVLCATFMAVRLQPWFEDIPKRQVKSPKVYVADSGILHALLGLATRDDLLGHPKCGSSWEGLAIHEVVRRLGARSDECFFWATHGGAELDLLVVRGKRRIGFEIKLTDSPRITPSMRSAMEALALERLDVIHAGRETWPIAPKVRAVAMSRLLEDLEPSR